MIHAGQHVTYYSPFSHYLAADVVRLAMAFAAVGLGLIVLLIAYRRWIELLRSASWFLIAVTMSMGVHAYASLIGLGRPPTWGLLVARGLLFPIVVYACYLVVKESRGGHWSRRGQ